MERALTDHIRKFLLELGVGFAFVGSQYRLEVGGEDFYIDLLFYHLRLRCFVVIELTDAYNAEAAITISEATMGREIRAMKLTRKKLP